MCRATHSERIDVMNLETMSREEKLKLKGTLDNYKAILKMADTKIREHNYELYHYDTQKSLESMMEEYSINDIAIATALAINKNDGRYTKAIKQWALELRTENDLIITDDNTNRGDSPLYFALKYYSEVNTHPTVFNSFAEKVMAKHKIDSFYNSLEYDYLSPDFQSSEIGGGYPITIALNTNENYAYIIPKDNDDKEFEKLYQRTLEECIKYGKRNCCDIDDYNNIAKSLADKNDFLISLELTKETSPFPDDILDLTDEDELGLSR